MFFSLIYSIFLFFPMIFPFISPDKKSYWIYFSTFFLKYVSFWQKTFKRKKRTWMLSEKFPYFTSFGVSFSYLQEELTGTIFLSSQFCHNPLFSADYSGMSFVLSCPIIAYSRELFSLMNLFWPHQYIWRNPSLPVRYVVERR